MVIVEHTLDLDSIFSSKRENCWLSYGREIVTSNTRSEAESLESVNRTNTKCPLQVKMNVTRTGVPLVGEPDINAILLDSVAKGVLLETSVVVGFLKQKPFELQSNQECPNTDPIRSSKGTPYNAWRALSAKHSSSSSHTQPSFPMAENLGAQGSALNGMRLFKEWLKHSPSQRSDWSRDNMVLYDIFNKVQRYVSNVFPKFSNDDKLPQCFECEGDRSMGEGHRKVARSLEPTEADCTDFSNDGPGLLSDCLVSEHHNLDLDSLNSYVDSEEAVVGLLLTHVPGGLYVFTGSIHVGYCSVTDAPHRVKLPPLRRGNQPIWALVFELSPWEGGGDEPRRCVLYPSELSVRRYLDSLSKEKRNVKLPRIEKIKTSYRDVEITKLTPFLCEKLAGSCKPLEYLRTRLMEELRVELFVTVDRQLRKLTISVVTDECLYKIEIVTKELLSFVTAEKNKILTQATSFAYPKPGDDVIVSVAAGGSVLDVQMVNKSTTGKRHTYLLLASGALDLDIDALSEKFGRVEKYVFPGMKVIKNGEPYVWGTIHCPAADKGAILMNDRFDWTGTLPKNVVPIPPSPAIPSDGNFLTYLRVPVELAKVITKVILEKVRPDWNPVSAVEDGWVKVCGRRCRALWFGDGTGSIKTGCSRGMDRRGEIIRDVHQAYGEGNVNISLKTSYIGRGASDKLRMYFYALDGICNHDSDLLTSGSYWISPGSRNPDGSDICDRVDLNFLDMSRGMEMVTQYSEQMKNGYGLREIRYSRPQFCMSTLLGNDVFKTLKEDLVSFGRALVENKTNVELNVSRSKSDKITLVLSGEDLTTVKGVGNQLQEILKPDIVDLNKLTEFSGNLVENAEIFLTSPKGCLLLNNIEKTHNSKMCHTPDKQSLAVYGSVSSRHKTVTELKDLLKHLPVPLKLPVDNHVVLTLMKIHGSDFKGLCADVNAENIRWSAQEKCLVVWGTEEACQSLRAKILSVQSVIDNSIGASIGPVCSACLCPAEQEVTELTLCGHAYCTSCLDLHVEIAVKDRNLPLRCVAEDCDEPLLLPDIVKSCERTANGVTHLLNAAVRLYMAQLGKKSPIAYCLTPDCPALYFVADQNEYTGVKVTCTTCHASKCNKCHVTPFHDDYTCAMWKNRNHVDGQTAHWFSEDVKGRKQCPACAVGIEKVSGCYNVVCGNCRRSICFECGKVFSTSNDCYRHMCSAARR